MKFSKCFLIAILLATYAKAQQNYAVSLISKDLLAYANAVVRNQEVTVKIKDYDNTIYHIKKAITILNSNGDDAARIVLWYDKSRMIETVKGVTYDEFGKPISKFSKKDFTDQAAIHDFSLFEDTRVKHMIPSIGAYPYTIEYEYDVKTKQTLNIDGWHPNGDYGLAVESSKYTFLCPSNFNIRYKENKCALKSCNICILRRPEGL